MMKITLELTAMANGGAALGRDSSGRIVFVPYGIPGEKVIAEVDDNTNRFTWGQLLEVVNPAEERIEPSCPHFGVCGGCHFQHIRYEKQLSYKRYVLIDQLKRIGHIYNEALVKPVLPNSDEWQFASDVRFDGTSNKEFGFWSPLLSEVIPIDVCPITQKKLIDVYNDIKLDADGLRSMVLRQGDDGELLVALDMEDDDPPALETDFPVSVVIFIEDGRVANLVGDNHIIRQVKERSFRVTAGSFFYPSSSATDLLIDVYQSISELNSDDVVLDLYSGVGTITAFSAESAREVIAVERHTDSVVDSTINLTEFDNVTLYEGQAEDILPFLETEPDLIVADPPPDGLSTKVIDQVAKISPARLIYISSDAATFSRDSNRLTRKGYQLLEVWPIDMYPQTYHTLAVSRWKRNI
jgi:23S rRNA (uracil1939-C5)-methyltransferase